MTELQEGEKYLSGSIGGKEGIRIALFKNKDKKPNSKEPDYVGHISLALWVSEKKAPENKATKEEERVI